MIISWRAGLLRGALFLSVGVVSSRANPIPSRILFPPLATVAENVVVTVRAEDALVSGRYRFKTAPDAPERWLRRPFRLALQMPVPVPRAIKRFEDIEPIVRPAITIKGQSYRPEKGLFHYNVLSLPDDAKLAIFFFRIERDDLGNEFELTMDYHQPFISSGGRELVFYVPFLPTYERDKERLGLSLDSYLVKFESPSEQPIRLATSVAHLAQSGPNVIAVHPTHLELIAIESTAGRGGRAPSIRLPLSATEQK